MSTMDFVSIERHARKLHDEEVRRVFARAGHALSTALHHVLHSLHAAQPRHVPKRYA